MDEQTKNKQEPIKHVEDESHLQSREISDLTPITEQEMSENDTKKEIDPSPKELEDSVKEGQGDLDFYQESEVETEMLEESIEGELSSEILSGDDVQEIEEKRLEDLKESQEVIDDLKEGLQVESGPKDIKEGGSPMDSQSTDKIDQNATAEDDTDFYARISTGDLSKSILIKEAMGSNIKVENNENYLIQNDIPISIRLEDWQEMEEFDYLPPIDVSLVLRLANQMIESRMLLLHCPDEPYLEKLISRIILELQKGNKDHEFSKKVYFNHFEDSNSKAGDKPITIGDFTNERFETESLTYLKAKVNKMPLLKSLYIKDQEWYNNVVHALKQKNVFMFCVIDRATFLEMDQQNDNSDKISQKNLSELGKVPYYNIAFVNYFIQHLFGEDESIVINQEIYSQFKNGLWGKRKSQTELRNMLIDSLGGDKDRIKAEVEKKADPNYQHNKISMIEELPFSKEPNRTAMFIATFFPDVSASDFRMLVEELIHGREVKVVVEMLKTEGKKSKKQNIVSTQSLSELWRQEGDIVLLKSGIQTRRLQNGKISYDFVELGVDDGIDEYFVAHHSMYLFAQYERLLDSGYFFDTGTSKLLIKNMMELMVEVATYDPDTYVHPLLRQIYFKLFLDREISFETQSKLNPEELDRLRKYKNFELEVGFKRLLELIRIMLNRTETLAPKINLFFDELLSIGLIDHLILFIKEYSHQQLVDPILWIEKILIKRNGDKYLSELITILLGDSRKWEGSAKTKLQQIYSWMPEDFRTKKYTLKQSYAALIMLQLADPIKSGFPLRLYGEYPPKFSVIRPIGNNEKALDHFKFLLNWLFNPHALNIYALEIANSKKEGKELESIKKDVGQELMKQRAFIIESWLLIINGFQHETIVEEKEELNQILFEAISQVLTPKQRLLLLKGFAFWLKHYHSEIGRLSRKDNKSDPMYLKLYLAKKETVIKLSNQLTSTSHGI